MSSSQSIVIRVSPESLTAQADRVLQRIHSVEEHFQNMEKTVRQSANYWVGDAGDAHRQVYGEYAEEIRKMLDMMRKTASVLEAMAENYRTGETEAEAEAVGLPTDIIV